MDGDDFDGAVGGLVMLAAIIMLGACVFGADWVRPPDEGAGPFVTPEREETFGILVLVAAGICLLCVVRAIWGVTATPLVTAAIAVVVVAGFATMLYLSPTRIELRNDGFGAPTVEATVRQSVVFYNSTGTDLVVCLGVEGVCDAEASGPRKLRSPGLVVPAGYRVSVKMPVVAGDFTVTLVSDRPEIERRDMMIRSNRIQGP
ncbi:hypothetical protein [Actinoplanes friuliensis]|uniref:Uncharacterized protein n=1 Tax=Actinoplanes friuliensis DSM 7358 TaxID=1246995 RepID=U5VZ39_9ACTN|nr:hypothetical protein [Actinoplanes friuliensis]AGZ40995.1 hypothetical protein AFR_13545 [Actinoplanes friuliensis DSM 7358]